MRTTTIGTIAFAGTLAFSAGCADSLNRFTVNSTAPVLKKGSGALNAEPDVQFAREAAPASLLTIETFLVTAPDNPDLLEIVARGYGEYAFGFLEDDLDSLPDNADDATRARLTERATEKYDRALRYAIRLASLRAKNFEAALKGTPDELDALLKDRFTKPEHGPALYLTGLALGSGINLNKDDMGRVADLPKVVRLLERAHELSPSYANYGPAMALGTVYAAQGKAMGGDPDRAKKMFEESINATGGKYLMAKTLYARFYGTVSQDRALFEKTLKEVLDTPASVMPEQRLGNELAKRRAARYLAHVEDWFLPPEPADTGVQK